jgi:sugar/nucleoside kinase (ribokinase family)
LLAHLAKGEELNAAIAIATKIAAKAVTSIGARPTTT